MEDDALDKMLSGITTIEEMSRATGIKVDLGRPEQVPTVEEGEPELIPIDLEEKMRDQGAILAEKDVEEYQRKITSWLSK